MTNCFIVHFKAKGLLPSEFAFMGAGTHDKRCDEYVGDYSESMLEYFQRVAGPDMGPTIADAANAKNFGEVALREEFYQATKTTLKWTPKIIAQISEEFESKLLEIIKSTDFLNQIVGESYFGSNLKTFDKYVGDKFQTQYCLNQFVVAKNLIVSGVKVDVNPKNVETTTVDCEKIMKELLVQFGYVYRGDSKFTRKACHDVDIDHKLPSIYADLAEVAATQFERTEEQKKAQRSLASTEYWKLAMEGDVCDYETYFFNEET